ncbi:MAG: class I mannose-6-phosphate isomerase [Muribaculaceae bacterium]|nr:class I mannose-6-phosphate isomerase [Muribaculaceae bacterium]
MTEQNDSELLKAGVLKFTPIYKTVIWGGDAISRLKGEPVVEQCVGESWEISAVPGHESVVAEGPLAGKSIPELMAMFGADFVGRVPMERFGDTFPLLIKLIDARHNLSVQVHPDDKLARERHDSPGKTEMWYVVACRPGSHIYCGLKAPLSREEYPACASDGSIMQRIAAHDSAPGQFYYIPAGTLHAIGAGNLIAEVQQTSDITYRVYDYGRVDADGNPRELHTELAADAIDFRFPNETEPTAKSFPDGKDGAVSCPYFNVDLVPPGKTVLVGDNPDSFTIIMTVGGEARIQPAYSRGIDLHRGHTVLLPAIARAHRLIAKADTLVITIK